ncbi:hypothetical protein OPQ81_000189 [Rhizoctonia solani]|nr:hypothetical protein OPQ81_000189 [Rhizoctonia solani]
MKKIPPESHPAGSEEQASTGPTDSPPGASKGEQYPPQLHAGKVGYGPHYAEVHGKDTGLGAKVTGVKEQLKGKITRNPELEQQGKERKTGELATKQQAEDDAKNPFQKKEEEEGAHDPAGTTGSKDPSDTKLKPGVSKTDTEGAPTAERIPSSTGVSTTEARDVTGSQDVPTAKPRDTPITKSHDILTTKPQEIPTTKSQDAPRPTTRSQSIPTSKSQGAPAGTTEQEREDTIRH